MWLSLKDYGTAKEHPDARRTHHKKQLSWFRAIWDVNNLEVNVGQIFRLSKTDTVLDAIARTRPGHLEQGAVTDRG